MNIIGYNWNLTSHCGLRRGDRRRFILDRIRHCIYFVIILLHFCRAAHRLHDVHDMMRISDIEVKRPLSATYLSPLCGSPCGKLRIPFFASLVWCDRGLNSCFTDFMTDGLLQRSQPCRQLSCSWSSTDHFAAAQTHSILKQFFCNVGYHAARTVCIAFVCVRTI